MIGWIGIAIVLESLQGLIVLAVVSYYVPVDASYFMTRAFDNIKEGFYLTRQVLLYRIFALLNVVLAYVAWRVFRGRFNDVEFVRSVKNMWD